MTILHTPERMTLALHTNGLGNLWFDLHLCSLPILNAFRAEHGEENGKKEKKPQNQMQKSLRITWVSANQMS